MFESQLKCRCHQASNSSRGFFISEAKPDYAPDRLIDVTHIKLELNVDLSEKKLIGVCTTEFVAVASGVGKLKFDAIDLAVNRVLDASGAELRFAQDEKSIVVYLRKGLRSGESSHIQIRYEVVEPRAGLYFIAPDKNYPNNPWQLWTQGQDQDNRYWIPCHDYPNEKATTEMIVTVAEKFTAISNGRLEKIDTDSKNKTKTFHWKHEIPHASYLITLCVGEFVEIKDSWKNSEGKEIPVNFYTLPGRERETKVSFGKTAKMIDFFSKKIGVDYPYEKYAQVVAWDFIYGGMENTSATTQTEYTLHPESLEKDYSSEPLVAHELAHQWFGDLLTCKEWAHAWLNEGFATYFETLWTEFEHGKDEFLYELYTNEQTYKSEDAQSYRRPIVTNIYLSPSDIFDRHLYEKGSLVLHMLRRLVGDELWWKSVNHYVKENFGANVETVDLQRSFEKNTGRSLSWFFDQWVFRPGHPDIQGSYEWIDDRRLAKFTLTQTQAKEHTSLYRLPLQIKIVTADGEIVHEVEFNEQSQTFWFPCSEKPKFVSVNPEKTVLANWKISVGRDALINQLFGDTDVIGRIFAAHSLAKDHSKSSVEALGKALKTEKFWGVQVEIAKALGVIGSTLAQRFLMEGLNLSHPKARKVVVQALSSFEIPEVFEKILKSDESPLVQYEAGKALGKTKAKGVFEILVSALDRRGSWHEYYNRGILQGLAELKFEDRVIPILTKYTKLGLPVFTRREAVQALTKIGKVRPALVIDTLLDLTKDSNFFVKLAVIEGLAELGDSKATSSLQYLADSVVEPRTKRSAILAAKTLRHGKTVTEDTEKLRIDFDKLREDYKALLSRIEKLEPVSELQQRVPEQGL